MVQLSYRQGLIRSHVNAIQFTAGNTALKVDGLSEPITYTFADGIDLDYFFEESTVTDPAWINIPSSGTFWIFYRLDEFTGERQFGFTTFQPIDDPVPPSNPPIGQYWFDTKPSVLQMFVWQKPGPGPGRWVPTIVVFAAKVQGLVISQFALESQAGLNTPVRAGKLLFDNENNTRPLKRFDKRGRGKFITTETPIFSQFSNLTGFRPEQSVVDGRAIEAIGKYQCVALKGSRELGLAKTTDIVNPCIGIILEEAIVGEVRSYVTTGYLTDDNFNTAIPTIDFSKPPGTLLFVDRFGQITDKISQSVSLQRVGILVDEFTILVKVEPQIIY